MENENSFKSLLVLADDPDESIWLSVQDAILEKAEENLDILHEFWKNSESLLASDRIEELINQLNFRALLNDFHKWTKSANPTLKRGVVLISKVLLPDFNEDDLEKLLSPIKKSIWIELNSNLTALEKVRIINHLIFEKTQISFKSSLDSKAIHFFIPTLLKNNEGHPLAITILILLLARELDLTIFKVSNGDIPALAYLDVPEFLSVNPNRLNEYDTLFYISLDHHIDVFGKKQFGEYIDHLHITDNQDLKIVPDMQLIRIMLLKLKLLYEEENNDLKYSQISQLLQVCNNTMSMKD